MKIIRYDFKCQFKKFLDRSVKFSSAKEYYIVILPRALSFHNVPR